MTISLIVIPGILIIFIILFFVIYPTYYRRKINKSLQDGKPIKTIEPVYIFGGIISFVIILLSFISFTSIREQKNMIYNLNSDIQTLEFNNNRILDELWSLKDDVMQSIQQGSYIQYVEYEVIDEIDGEENLYNVLLTFSLTENVETSDSTLHVDSSDTSMSYPLSNVTTRQTIEIPLNLNEDYTIYVAIDDGVEVVKHDFVVFNLYQYLLERFNYYVEFDTNVDQASFDFYLSNQWENASSGIPALGLKISEVHVLIKFNGTTLTDENYTTPTVWGSHNEIYSHRYIYDDLESANGTWEFHVTIIDQYGIEYENIQQ